MTSENEHGTKSTSLLLETRSPQSMFSGIRDRGKNERESEKHWCKLDSKETRVASTDLPLTTNGWWRELGNIMLPAQSTRQYSASKPPSKCRLHPEKRVAGRLMTVAPRKLSVMCQATQHPA